ncbi:MAG: DUF4386 domain-containing protein [Terriglobia bacterium]
MRKAIMMERIREASPRLKARIAGLFYLLIFVATPSDAARATATRMLVTLTSDTAVALIFYDLLKPVSSRLSLLAAFFRLIFVVVMAVTSLNYLTPLTLLKGAHSPAAFMTGDLIALVFFGFHCLLIGYLIFKSTFLPRILGALLIIAGPAYLINSFANLFTPAFAHALWPYILSCWLLAEGLLTLWLLVIGVNVRRWKEQSSAAEASIRA